MAQSPCSEYVKRYRDVTVKERGPHMRQAGQHVDALSIRARARVYASAAPS
jgi:hypothetical protein